jgi:cytoskeleton protein RodZ
MTQDKITLGDIVKKARVDQKLSLEEISVLTRIKEKYLIAIEANNFDVLPSPVQKKGFVRAYAKALGLDPVPLINQLRLLIDVTMAEENETAPVDSPPDKPAEQIQPLGEIGGILKSQRERLGFNIPNIENQIFIPERYLKAIEAGKLEELPSTVQGRGMVKNYAQFLGLDPEPLLLNYAEALQSRLPKNQLRKSRSSGVIALRVRLRRVLTSPSLSWVAVVLLIGMVSIWSAALIFGNREAAPEITETIPGVADILLPSLTFTPTQEPPEGTPGEIELDIAAAVESADSTVDEGEPTETPGLTGNEKVQVQLIIIRRTWVRVTVDNILAFEGRLLPGSVKLFGGQLSIEVLTGNAAGVEVIFNQRDLGLMGLYGEVIDRVYTAEGIATPTPTITSTPTPSVTPEASLTQTPTMTPEPE